jgi:HD-GYP domain-containing protein (c-di-GMP phosphodiesterase class II)
VTDDETGDTPQDPARSPMSESATGFSAGVAPGAAEASGLTEDGRAPKVLSVVYSYNQLRRARELLSRFYGARRALRFYPAGHPAVEESVAGLAAMVGHYHAEGVDVVLTFFEDELLLGEQLLTEESVLFDQLIRDMISIGAGSVTFMRGVDRDEMVRVMRVLASDVPGIAKLGGIDAAMRAAAAEHVRVAAVSVAEREEPTRSGEEREEARESYRVALEVMRDLERMIQANGTIHAAPVRGVVRSLLDSVLTNRYAMLELSGLKNYDEYTFYHSINVTILSLALGAMIVRDNRFLSSLGAGALMHDIGKVVIDVATLNKPGALSSDEWTEVRKHPAYGAEQAVRTAGLDKAAVVIILEHHMRFDGCGYPQRFPIRRQRLASRIVAVADAYDAMTSQRSYSAARLPDEAMSVLASNAGSAFDSALVRLFVTMMGCYPPRSVVRLSTGETGVVLVPNETHPVEPRVRVFAAPDGTMVQPFDLDLSEEADDGRSIVRCLDPAGLNVDVEDFL